MTDVDSWSAERGDTVHHHETGEELNGMGERDYVEHIKANRPSLSERFIIIGALLLLGVAGLTAHMNGSMASGVDTSPVGSVSETIPSLEYCREHSPYADQSC
jgi:hypothetical protein